MIYGPASVPADCAMGHICGQRIGVRPLPPREVVLPVVLLLAVRATPRAGLHPMTTASAPDSAALLRELTVTVPLQGSFVAHIRQAILQPVRLTADAQLRVAPNRAIRHFDGPEGSHAVAAGDCRIACRPRRRAEAE